MYDGTGNLSDLKWQVADEMGDDVADGRVDAVCTGVMFPEEVSRTRDRLHR